MKYASSPLLKKELLKVVYVHNSKVFVISEVVNLKKTLYFV